MLFNSVRFILFFIVLWAVYNLLPYKFRWLLLLGASAYFYMCWKAKYIVLIGFSIAVTWLGSLVIDDSAKNGRKKLARLVLFVTLAANLGVLFLFKYFNFFADNIAALSNGHISLPLLSFALPVGISFYTFQAIGYTVDVYRGEMKPERNPLVYALFILFFPQLVAGPIERSKNLLPQLRNLPRRVDIDQIRSGLLLMAWGFFTKLVIADRVAIIVDAVYDNVVQMDGMLLILATVLFAIQIYCDFASYSNIARGAAQVFGVRLMKNFDSPYFAKSMAEFWQRWHISLSTWFEDYIYIPFIWSGNACAVTPYLGIFFVFLVSGFWHGASWTYVLWGLLHALFRITEALTKKWRKKISRKMGLIKMPKLHDCLRTVSTFLLVDFTYIFFRATTVQDAFCAVKKIFGDSHPAVLFNGSLSEMGLDIADWSVALISIAVLVLIDTVSLKVDVREKVLNMRLPLRWTVCLLLVVGTVIFGVYGPEYSAAPFFYFQF